MNNVFNDVLFAVTREDHQIESSLIKKYEFKKVLTVCSGGCVPLSLKTLYPNLSLMAFDINPHQIEHVKKKVDATRRLDLGELNVGEKNDNCLNQSGKFEKMFQDFRENFYKNISDFKTVERFFYPQTTTQERKMILESWTDHKKIQLPFSRVFNNSVIEKVFSRQATQHAKKNTYINYFKKKIMEGLGKTESYLNPFLQHIFLGCYNSSRAFPYINNKNLIDVEYCVGTLCDIEDIDSYDLISLSNIFDWCNKNKVGVIAEYLSSLKKGSAILLRQLNNNRNWYKVFESNFNEDKTFDSYWQRHDRSLFYNHFRLFIKK